MWKMYLIPLDVDVLRLRQFNTFHSIVIIAFSIDDVIVRAKLPLQNGNLSLIRYFDDSYPCDKIIISIEPIACDCVCVCAHEFLYANVNMELKLTPQAYY